jgi:peptide/nickel transport system permease protein
VFGIRLEWFPAVGGYDDSMVPNLSWEFISSASYYYVLPFLSIFLIVLGGQAIGMRSMCIYELGTDYVKYAKLLGIRESKILLYMFRNAMLPQLTGLALALGAMVGGALITEMIFSYPGLGMAVLTAIQGNDYSVITGCTLLVTVTVLIANFSVDILVGLLDPRIRAAQGGGGK